MTETAPDRVRIIAVGNRLRGDDAAGPLVLDALAGTTPANVELFESDGEPTRLLDLFDGAARVVLVDLVVTGAAPGTVITWDPAVGQAPGGAPPTSSHGSGVAEALALARELDRLPAQVLVVGIEGESVELGAPPSAAVAAAIPSAARQSLSAAVAPSPTVAP